MAWRWDIGANVCRELVSRHALRFGPAWSPPWVGACNRMLAAEIANALLVLEGTGAATFTAVSSGECLGQGCLSVKTGNFNGAAAASYRNVTDGSAIIVLNTDHCFFTQPCELCFDDSLDSLHAWRRGLSIVTIMACLFAGFWWLEVLSTKQLNPKSYGELAQEIWRQKKQKVALEEKERLCEVRIEKISQQKGIFQVELERKSSRRQPLSESGPDSHSHSHSHSHSISHAPHASVDAHAHSRTPAHLDSRSALIHSPQSVDDDEDEDDEVAAKNMVMLALAHKIEDLDDRLNDEDAQRLEVKMQAVKLDGAVAVMERSMRGLLAKNRRARFVWSATMSVVSFHAFYVFCLCPHKSPDHTCSSLQQAIAEQAAAVTGLALPKYGSLGPAFSLALARQETATWPELGDCFSPNNSATTAPAASSFDGAVGSLFSFASAFSSSLSAAPAPSPPSLSQQSACVDRLRAARAAQLAQQYHAAECGSLLRGWRVGGRLGYAKSLQMLLSRLVRHAGASFVYSPQHRAAESSYCDAWAAVVQAVTSDSPQDLRSLDYDSPSVARAALKAERRWETLALSLLHRTLSGDRDVNTDGIDDSDRDGNAVPDVLQASLDAFLRTHGQAAN